MAPRSWAAEMWPERSSGRRRVLIESADTQWASEQILRQAGYEVAVCGGPDQHDGSPCPLVQRGLCHLAAGADAIVNSFCLSRPQNRAVIGALRARHASTPLIVEASARLIGEHGAVLEGCQLARWPMTASELVQKVDRALA